jgi:hypothetical protein
VKAEQKRAASPSTSVSSAAWKAPCRGSRASTARRRDGQQFALRARFGCGRHGGTGGADLPVVKRSQLRRERLAGDPDASFGA